MRKLSIVLLVSFLAALGAASRPEASGLPPSAISFRTYKAPADQPGARDAGETSIGVVRSTNEALFQMGLSTARVEWDEDGDATWTNVSFRPTSTVSLDPILWTDVTTGRTFVTQLLGLGSAAAFTDDAGRTWTPMQPPVSAPSFDHQTIGGGPYSTLPGNALYPNAMYYCAQGLVVAQCARSDDGGLTWNAPVPTGIGCAAIHGHVAVGPDGSAYVPRGACGGRQGFYVSRDDGVTWNPVQVPGTTASGGGIRDPKIAFDAGGRMYFVTSSAGRPVVVTSQDGGRTWSDAVDVGETFGIRNTEFPAVVAGDDGRAAFSFFGTTTPGNDQLARFDGEWHVYVAYTFDGGETWQTVLATPGDPVQRGCIWLQGGGNPCRNLLDFQDVTVDAEGRVLVSYSDGCTSAACLGSDGTPAHSRDSWGTISRQTSGRRLFTAFDPSEPDPLSVSTTGPYTTSLDSPVTLHALPAGGTLPYTTAWDLDADGAFDDAEGTSASFVPSGTGTFPVAVRVTDGDGAQATATTRVTVGEAQRFDDAYVETWSSPGVLGYGRATATGDADERAGAVRTSAEVSDTFPVDAPTLLLGHAEATSRAVVSEVFERDAGRYVVTAVLTGVRSAREASNDPLGASRAGLSGQLLTSATHCGESCSSFTQRPVSVEASCDDGCDTLTVTTTVILPRPGVVTVGAGLLAEAVADGTASAKATGEATVSSITVEPAV